MFIMTSGLRSVRDKALTYFDEIVEEADEPHDKLFKAVNTFAAQLRRVAKEDKEYLQENGFSFDMHALIGGQMSNDREHKLYLVYPPGNWVEVGEGTPYTILGASSYGKPVLDRTLKFSDTMRFALKVGCLAFDSTRISAADVDYPIDAVVYQRDSFRMVSHRFEWSDLEQSTRWWQDRLRASIRELTPDWIETMVDKLGPDQDHGGLVPPSLTDLREDI
jgi:putative proteasome-type protease